MLLYHVSYSRAPPPIPAGLSRRVFTPPFDTIQAPRSRLGDRHLRLLPLLLPASPSLTGDQQQQQQQHRAPGQQQQQPATRGFRVVRPSSVRRRSLVEGRRLSPRRLERGALPPFGRPTRSFSRSAAFRIAADMALAAGAFGALSDDEDERSNVFGAVVGGFASSNSEPEEEERLEREQVGGKLELQLEMPADASSALWNLISPCSEPDEAFFEEQQDEEGDRKEGDEHARLETLKVEIPPLIVEDASALADVSDDESEQEMEQVDAESFWAAVERESVWCQSDDDSGDDDSEEEDSSPPAPVPDPVQEAATDSNSHKTPAMWTRLKARSYAGASSAGVQAAVASMKQRARTISSVGSRHKMQVDDGDFSSDDEDCQRTSDAPQEKRWRRRRPSMAFAARLSVPTPKMDSLRSASGKFGSKLNLYRSSSSNTVTSEESYLDSPNTANCETKSAPAAFHIGSKYLPAGKRTESLESKASYSNLHVQRNLRAGVVKAAVYLNSASVEAARKIKAKTTTLRSQWHPEASETEEDEVDTRASSICEAAAVAH